MQFAVLNLCGLCGSVLQFVFAFCFWFKNASSQSVVLCSSYMRVILSFQTRTCLICISMGESQNHCDSSDCQLYAVCVYEIQFKPMHNSNRKIKNLTIKIFSESSFFEFEAKTRTRLDLTFNIKTQKSSYIFLSFFEHLRV